MPSLQKWHILGLNIPGVNKLQLQMSHLEEVNARLSKATLKSKSLILLI